MKAWRFYDFGDFRLDDIPVPELRPRHVLVEPLCVQPSVNEAQLAFGIPTLAYERVKKTTASGCAHSIVWARILRTHYRSR